MKNLKHSVNLSTIALVLLVLFLGACGSDESISFHDQVMQDKKLDDLEKLGKLLFFEKSLSGVPEGHSCAFCHNPDFAFTDRMKEFPTSKGAGSGRFNSRSDMPVSYSFYAPPLEYDENEEVWFGGLFWDGRADNLIEQAIEPIFNPVEMAVPDTAFLFQKLQNLEYREFFIKVFGPESMDTPGKAISNTLIALDSYQRSDEVNPFSSKYDSYLKGEVQLSENELRGMALFVDEDKGNCAACHPVTPNKEGEPVLFTDFTYDNLGIPRNPANPYYRLPTELNPMGPNYVDYGLGKIVNDSSQNGKFKVPTLRNVAITPPYMHNGYFRTLWDVIAFYNTRDVEDWPQPEIPETINRDEMGDLGLSNQDIEDIIAFLNTLTDDR